jgi:hypothetical protein
MCKRNLFKLFGCVALVAVSATIATMSSAQAPAPPAAAPAPPPLPQMPPSLVPAHVVDLMTADGSAVFGAQWKTIEAKIVEVPAIANAMPEYKTTYDIKPHAGAAGFDDSSWPAIEATGLAARRGGGRVSFIWYRTVLTIPAVSKRPTQRPCSRPMSTTTRRSGSTGRCRAAVAIPARPPSKALTCPIAWCWRTRSSRATNSRSRSSASMGRFQSRQRTSSGSAQRRSSFSVSAPTS